MADAAVDTSALDSTPAIELIPLGMYMLSTLECNHQILVYNSTQNAYQSLIRDLPNLMEHYGIEGETIPEETLDDMTEHCFQSYFDENMIPSCNRNDIEHLLKFYAQKAVAPLFVTIDEMERKSWMFLKSQRRSTTKICVEARKTPIFRAFGQKRAACSLCTIPTRTSLRS